MEGHFSIKFTALMDAGLMTKFNTAQSNFINKILNFNGTSSLSKIEIGSSLYANGIQYS